MTGGLQWSGTGEHGVGTGKKKYLDSELGTETVKTMERIKATLDPFGLFNPGKVGLSWISSDTCD